jgi:hypothetical protein
MGKYRKKSVVIEAIQYTGETIRLDDVPSWLINAMLDRVVIPSSDEGAKEFYIETLEGRMTVSVGDWIIRGVKGEIYPCKPDIFAATYDPA